MEEQNKIIKELLEELLGKMGFDSSVEINEADADEQEGVVCNIITKEDSSLLIGQYGVNLQAIQHIARLLIRKRTSEKARFIIDVNSYRKQKNESVIDMAKEAAEQALSEKRSIVLKPMSNYELSKNDKVVTESIGEGESRKVVVKPVDFI